MTTRGRKWHTIQTAPDMSYAQNKIIISKTPFKIANQNQSLSIQRLPVTGRGSVEGLLEQQHNRDVASLLLRGKADKKEIISLPYHG